MSPIQTVTPVQTKRLWQKAEAGLAGHNSMSVDPARRLIGHFFFDSEAAVWWRKAPAAHAAKKVRVELDRQSSVNRTRTKEMHRPILAWSFPDSGV